MAELTLAVKYRSPTARMLFILMCVLLPLWAIASPLSLLQFVSLVLKAPQAYELASVFSTVLSLLAFSLASAAAFAITMDNRIYITRYGITFPLFLSSKLGFRRHRNWEELLSAGLVGSSPAAHGRKPLVLLSFSGEKSISVDLSAVGQEEQEQLFMAIELWAPQCERTPALCSYQNDLHDRGRLTGKAGYTQIWQEELSRRFSTTSFVPLEPGARLQSGKIEVIRQLAFGGLSALYLAQRDGCDLVVLKEAVVPSDADPELRRQADEQLAREAKMLSALEHPRITKVLDYLVEDGRHYMVLEYFPGQDLRQFVRQQGVVDEPSALGWALQIVDLLVYLHAREKPVIHRDLTPENLIVTEQKDIILIDFGAANQFVGMATGTVVGKQAYIPPEQLRGKAVCQSDIYAFGGTLYFLLTGTDPRPLAVSYPKDLVPGLSDQINLLVARCLAFSAGDRYASALELRDALSAINDSFLAEAGRS